MDDRHFYGVDLDLRPLVAIPADNFLSREFKPREAILAPWLHVQGLAMIHAPRGIGKTHLSLGIAHAVATGCDFLGWPCPKVREVLFIDGEMPAVALQDRLGTIVRLTGKNPGSQLRIITPDMQELGIPDLASRDGQALINEQVWLPTELIILDNLSSLIRSGGENEAESWEAVQAWLLQLRRQGKAVLFIHHSGKTGNQRGTSKREDVLDTVIKLERPSGYKPSEGAVFRVCFEKARHFYGEQSDQFIAKYAPDDPEGPWIVSRDNERRDSEVLELFKKGMQQKDIAKILELSESTVSRRINEAKTAGKLEQEPGKGEFQLSTPRN